MGQNGCQTPQSPDGTLSYVIVPMDEIFTKWPDEGVEHKNIKSLDTWWAEMGARRPPKSPNGTLSYVIVPMDKF